jgi:hypothetical protein
MTGSEFKAWLAETEGSRNRWKEDHIYHMNHGGFFYYTGGIDGVYMKVDTEGNLTIGKYEGAYPHLGEAAFKEVLKKQFKDINDAFTAMMETGGIKFLVDMFSADNHSSVIAQRDDVDHMYPPGTRVELRSLCNDEQGMPNGLRGTVMDIDDPSSLHMNWDNGRTSSLLPGEDSFRKLTPKEITAEQEQSQNEGSGMKME